MIILRAMHTIAHIIFTFVIRQKPKAPEEEKTYWGSPSKSLPVSVFAGIGCLSDLTKRMEKVSDWLTNYWALKYIFKGHVIACFHNYGFHWMTPIGNWVSLRFDSFCFFFFCCFFSSWLFLLKKWRQKKKKNKLKCLVVGH